MTNFETEVGAEIIISYFKWVSNELIFMILLYIIMFDYMCNEFEL